MKEAEQYRQYAADCLRIGKSMRAPERDILLKMAEAWEARAKETEKADGKGDVAKDSIRPKPG